MSLPGSIAQVTIPSDAVGAPSMIVVDWINAHLFLLGSGGQRAYDIALATQSPTVSTTGAPHDSIAPNAAACDFAGNVLWQGGFLANAIVYELDPTTLTVSAQFGVDSNSGSYPDAVKLSQQIVTITVSAVSYILCKSLVDGYVYVLRSDDMTAAGGALNLTRSGLTFMVPGVSAHGSTATAYLIDNTLVTGAEASIGVYRITISAGAENYDIASWPTPNPDIAGSQIGAILAADVDASWTSLSTNSLGYDTNGNVIVCDVSSGNVANSRYLIGLDPVTARILWRLAVPSSGTFPIDLTQSRIANSNLPYLNSSATTAPLLGVQTQNGADTTNTLPNTGAGLTGFLTSADDTSQLMIIDADYSGGTGAPTPVSGTASSFTGLAILGAWPPFPSPPAPTSGPPGLILPTLGGWRGIVGINWRGLALVGDAYAGIVGLSDFDTFTEYGQAMQMLVTSPPIQNDRKRVFIRRFEVDVQTGVSTDATPDPKLNLEFSRNGGETWVPLRIARSMGLKGEYGKRLRWLNLGQSRSWVLRLTCSDPVRRVIIGTYVDDVAGIG